MKIIGLDIGTTTISGVLIDTDEMMQIESETIPNNTSLQISRLSERNQEPVLILNICQQLINYFKNKYPKIDAIGLTGQMHGMLYIDQSGEAASNLITWQDERGNDLYKQCMTYCRYMESKTGYPMATGFGLTTHFFNSVNELIPKNAVTFCTIADYIAMKLSRNDKPVIHTSNAAGLGLFDLDTQEFDLTAVEKVGIQPDFLPIVFHQEKIIGYTQEKIPVCIPIGDNQASYLGSVDAHKNLLVNIGTGSQISLRVDQIIKDCPLEYRPYIAGEFLLVGSSLCGGSAYQLITEFSKDILRMYGIIDINDSILYEKMEETIQEIYGMNNTLHVDTRFRGTRKAPNIRGSIDNITIDNFKPGYLAYGVLQGICRELKGFYDQIPPVFLKDTPIIGSGNALRKNATLRKVLSNTFGKKIIIPQFKEEASLGAAILAASILENGKNIMDLQKLIKY